jgi:dCTP deaminase
MSILTGRVIRDQWERGRIHISPFDNAQLNPVSYDLTLGRSLKVYREVVDLPDVYREAELGIQHDSLQEELPKLLFKNSEHLRYNWRRRVYSDTDNETVEMRGEIGDYVHLQPGIGYLCHTEEAVGSEYFVPVLDGKSSLGRLFVAVHITAGYGDPGFKGQWTLEVVVTQPVQLQIGQRIAQVRFHTIEAGIYPVDLYNGRYRGDATGELVRIHSYDQWRA